MIDPYKILGVNDEAPDYVIKAAYRACLKQVHPDVYSGHDAVSRTANINGAFELLCDPARRALYDASGRNRTSGTEREFDLKKRAIKSPTNPEMPDITAARRGTATKTAASAKNATEEMTFKAAAESETMTDSIILYMLGTIAALVATGAMLSYAI
jgi:DnaJ-class molecular chaperone